jgi:resuscitation-promoting factor RpfA
MPIRWVLRVSAVLLVTAAGWGATTVTLARWARTLARPLLTGRAAGDTAVDAVAGAAAAGAAIAVTTWFALALAGAVLSTARQQLRARGAACCPARHTAAGAGTRAPAALRRLAALLLGAGLAAAPAGPAASAAADGSRPDRPAAVTSLDRPAARVPAVVRIRPGDSLWAIAARHLGGDPPDAAVAHAWPRWHHANRARIGADPDRLVPGQLLHPPTTEESR